MTAPTRAGYVVSVLIYIDTYMRFAHYATIMYLNTSPAITHTPSIPFRGLHYSAVVAQLTYVSGDELFVWWG